MRLETIAIALAVSAQKKEIFLGTGLGLPRAHKDNKRNEIRAVVLPFRPKLEPIEVPDENPDRGKYTARCDTCGRDTLHKDGKCLICKK